jgi:tetratricopeptide (TPR) repeat protein
MTERNLSQNSPPAGGKPAKKDCLTSDNDSVASVMKRAFDPLCRGNAILLCLLLFGLVLWVFLPVIHGAFIERNDSGFVTGNTHINLTPANVAWAFCHSFDANWLPLTLWSFMLDHQLYGLKPWGYHLTNVLLHAVNTVLLFLVLRRMTGLRPEKSIGAKTPQAGATWRSLMVAALFGLHPLRVESVAWISERKDVLSVQFWMLTLWAYTRFAQGRSRAGCRVPGAGDSSLALGSRPSTFDYYLALAFFALGLMSKPMMVTLPCVLLVLDYWPLGRWQQKNRRGLLVEKAPFFLLSAIVSVVTYSTQKNADMMSNVLTGLSLSFSARLENALVSYGRYLGKLFWPVDLCVLYPYPDHWPMQKILFAGLLVLGLSVLVFVMRRQRPYLLTGWLWYLGTLVPVLGLVPVGAQAMADRYSYIPSVGILIVLVWGTCQMTRGWHYQSIGLGAVGGMLVLICIVLTRHQLGYWKDDVSVWERAIAVTENNYDAHNMLGRAWYAQGRMDDAIREIQEVVRLNPDFAEPYCNLGRAYVAKRREDEAIACYQKALEVRPDYVAAHNSLGSLLLQKGQVGQVMVHCQKALELEPDNVTAHNNLGFAFSLMGRLDEAAAQLQKVVEIQPDNEMAQNNLGSVLLRMGRVDEAIHHFRSALKLQPDSAETHNNLAGAFLSQKQMNEAIREFQEAARLQPDGPEIHRNLGYALGRQGRLDEAIREFQEALRLKPDYAEASNDLVIALGMKEKQTNQPAASTKP